MKTRQVQRKCYRNFANFTRQLHLSVSDSVDISLWKRKIARCMKIMEVKKSMLNARVSCILAAKLKNLGIP